RGHRHDERLHPERDVIECVRVAVLGDRDDVHRGGAAIYGAHEMAPRGVEPERPGAQVPEWPARVQLAFAEVDRELAAATRGGADGLGIARRVAVIGFG